MNEASLVLGKLENYIARKLQQSSFALPKRIPFGVIKIGTFTEQAATLPNIKSQHFSSMLNLFSVIEQEF